MAVKECWLYLSENKTLRLVTLCGLYIAQGIPWGFVTVSFASWLAKPEQGITTEQLGPILAVATLPWSFKFLWGPLMDRFSIRSLGRRRPWILFAQAMAILLLSSMLVVEDLTTWVWKSAPEAGSWRNTIYPIVPGPLAGLILLANVFVSMQDVAVDALAVDLLDEKERGIANGLMYGSSYLGTAIGGAGLGFVIARFGIQAGLCGQALLLSGIMLLPLCFRERRQATEVSQLETSRTLGQAPNSAEAEASLGAGCIGRECDANKKFRSSGRDRGTRQKDSMVANLLKAFTLRATVLGVVLAVVIKIGSGVVTTVLVDYLMKEGGWRQEEYTAVTGGWAVMLGLAGSVVGGFLADRWGPKGLIVTSSCALGLLWLIAGSGPGFMSSGKTVTVLILGQDLLLAIMSVSLFTLFMTISWPRVAATQFTAYMALMNLGTTIGSYAAGSLGQAFSISEVFLLVGGLQIFAVAPVLLIDPRETRRVLATEA